MMTFIGWALCIIYICGTNYSIITLQKRVKKLEEGLEWLNNE